MSLRISLIWIFVSAAAIVSLVIHYHRDFQTASISKTSVSDQTFSSPIPVIWSGTINRIFVSGSGLEVVSTAAPGGVFQAYMPGDQISPITSGAVQVQGTWDGYTCAYGNTCVPEVIIQTVKR